METKQIAAALVKAQKEMGTAVKDAKNPFFKSKYADLNSIREACMPALNSNGIVLLQPIVHIDGKNFVKTLLLHESGESIEGLTEIMYSKPNDAQAQGSGITYARRYGMQSLCNVGADDDDGNGATQPTATPKKEEAVTPQLPYLNINSDKFIGAVKYLKEGGNMDAIKRKFHLSEDVENSLIVESKS